MVQLFAIVPQLHLERNYKAVMHRHVFFGVSSQKPIARSPGQKPPNTKSPVEKPPRANAPLDKNQPTTISPPKNFIPKPICPQPNLPCKPISPTGCADVKPVATQQGGKSESLVT